MDLRKDIVVYILWILPASLLALCDLYQLEPCMKPLENHGSDANGMHTTFSKETVKELCGQFSGVSDCANKALEGCESKFRMLWDVVDNGIGYLCGEGLEDYLAESDCLGSANMSRAVQECSEIYTNEMTISRYLPKERLYSMLCKITDEYNVCVKGSVRSRCNARAVHVMTEIMTRSLKPVRNEMGCDTVSPGTIVGIILGVLAIFTVGASVGFYVYRRRTVTSDWVKMP